MKLAIIGGGSSYSPELIDGLFERIDAIPVDELWMMDTDAERLETTSGLARRMSASHGSPFEINATTDLEAAVDGARFVITQIRVGRMQARIADERSGLRNGIVGQETTGIGGFACALRTIPRVLEVARAMESRSPDGVLVNFTNPSGIITEALVRHSPITSVGLCNVPIGIFMELVEHLGWELDKIELDYTGLNHLSWVRRFMYCGVDRTSDAMEMFIKRADQEWEQPDVCENMRGAMRRLGMLCNPYLQYYYSTQAVLEHLSSKEKTRGEEVVEVERVLFEKYAREDLHDKPPELEKRGGAHYSTAAFQLIEAIQQDSRDRQIVCCRNAGAVPGFDDNAVLEVPAVIDGTGARAIPQPPPQHSIRGLMQTIKAYETMTVEAAVTGDRDAAFLAMLTHPLLPDARRCEMLLDELLEINREFLIGTFF